MCYEHILTQNPERLIEDEELEKPQTRAGSTDEQMQDDRSAEDRLPRETTSVPA